SGRRTPARQNNSSGVRVRPLPNTRRNVVARVDHGHLLADEIGGPRHQAVILGFRVLVVDRNVAALDKTYAAKALGKPSLHLRGSRTPAAARIPHHRARGLLTGAGRRQRRRAAEQRDEVAALHSITSSASASSLSGICRPSAWAVLRLTTSSNLVGCITGRSAGFSPLRTRPT